MGELDQYAYSVYSRLMDNIDDEWQDTESVLILFSDNEESARQRGEGIIKELGFSIIDDGNA
ncbi:MAG: hypothetical protein AB2L11_12785 [Syntrophobacteraceae bacterium]